MELQHDPNVLGSNKKPGRIQGFCKLFSGPHHNLYRLFLLQFLSRHLPFLLHTCPPALPPGPVHPLPLHLTLTHCLLVPSHQIHFPLVHLILPPLPVLLPCHRPSIHIPTLLTVHLLVSHVPSKQSRLPPLLPHQSGRLIQAWYVFGTITQARYMS